MALIGLEEAAKLGLLPDEWMSMFPAVGRSQLFGSPLAIQFSRRTSPSPLARGVGAFGLQHGGSAIQPPRFGLGPLMQGLGLSPSPSAVTAPGAVPVGRAASRSQSIADAATLVARGNPQDIALLARMEEQGLLPPGTFASLLRQGALPPAAAALVPIAGPARQGGEPSDGAEILGTTKRVLGLAREAQQFSEGEGTARAITDAIGITEPVTPSFARPSSSEAAFQAHRAGERQDFTGALGAAGAAIPDVGYIPGAFAPLAAPPALPFTPESFAPIGGAVGGGISAGAGAAPSAAANEAARQAILTGTTGTAGSLAGAAPLLPFVGALPGIAMAGSDQARQQAATTAALTAAGSIFGPVGSAVGALVGMALPLLGKLSPHRSKEAKLRAELLEAGRAGDIGRGAGSTLLQGDRDFEGLAGEMYRLQEGGFNVGLGLGDSPAQYFTSILADPNQAQADISAGVRRGLLGGNVTSMRQDLVTAVQRAAERPGAIDSLAKAEVAAKRRAVERTGQAEMEALRGEYFRPESQVFMGGEGGMTTSPALADTEGFTQATAPIQLRIQQELAEIDRRAAADPYAFLPPQATVFLPPQAVDTGPPPSSATPPPAPSADQPTLPEEEMVPSLRGGGSVTRTGLYRLHAGETVLPAGARGEDPNAPKAPHWYLPLTPGEPVQAKKNPDPGAYWRLAFTPEEAREAIQAGAAETPLLVPPGMLNLPARKRAAASEFLRRQQYENPQETLLDAVERTTPLGAAPPTTGRGLQSPPTLLPSVEDSTDDAIDEYYRKQEGEKYPWGPHLPIGRTDQGRRGLAQRVA